MPQPTPRYVAGTVGVVGCGAVCEVLEAEAKEARPSVIQLAGLPCPRAETGWAEPAPMQNVPWVQQGESKVVGLFADRHAEIENKCLAHQCACQEACDKDENAIHTGAPCVERKTRTCLPCRQNTGASRRGCSACALRHAGAAVERGRGDANVSQWDKILRRVLSGQADQNVRFADLVGLLRRLVFDERICGDRHTLGKTGVRESAYLRPLQA